MHRMIDQFEHVMNLLNNATSNGQTVGEIEMISETDKSEILAWNKGTHYEPVKVSLQDLQFQAQHCMSKRLSQIL